MELYHYNHNHDPKNGQFTNAPAGSTVVSKGTVFQRISTNPEKKPRGDRAYLSYKPEDNDYYTEHMTDFRGGVGRMFKVSYEAARDIYYPKHEKQVDEFVNLYKKYKIKTKKEISKELGERAAFSSGAPMQYSKMFANIFKKKFDSIEKDDSKLRTIGYQYFMAAYSDIPKTRKRYQESLKKQGYNAILDDNDVRYNNVFKGHPSESLIVFDPNDNLKIIGSEKLTQEEYNKAKARNKKRWG